MSTFRTGYPVTRFVVGHGLAQLIITDKPTVVPDTRDAEVIATAQRANILIYQGDATVPIGPGTRPSTTPPPDGDGNVVAYDDTAVRALIAQLATSVATASSTATAAATAAATAQSTAATAQSTAATAQSTAAAASTTAAAASTAANTAATAADAATAAAAQAAIPPATVTPQDHGLAAWATDPATQNTGTILVNGTVYLTKMTLRRAATPTNLYWWVQASGTGPVTGQNEVGLYLPDGTRVFRTNADAQLAAGLKTNAINPALAAALAPPFCWMAWVFNAATPPTLMRAVSGAGGSAALSVGMAVTVARFATNLTGQTALPASINPANNVFTGFAGPWGALG